MTGLTRTNLVIGGIWGESARIADRGDMNPLAQFPKLAFRAPEASQAEDRGLEALRRIKGLDPAARVVMVTALDQKQTIEEAIRDGAMDFIVKPFDRGRIVTLLGKIGGRNPRPDRAPGGGA